MGGQPKIGKAAYNRQYHKANKERQHAAHQRYYQEVEKPRKRLKKYGITQDQYDAMLAAQGFLCAICKTDTPGSWADWHVDHCHVAGHVRGLLCDRCNRGLGLFRDNPDFLKAASEYILANEP